MNAAQKLVAVVSPWEKLPELVKNRFRVQSLPKEKNVAVWRDDLQTEAKLSAALKKLGVTPVELRARPVTEWQDVE